MIIIQRGSHIPFSWFSTPNFFTLMTLKTRESAEISFYQLVLFFFPTTIKNGKVAQNTLSQTIFVNNLSRKQYYNVLQGCKTDLILADEGKKEPVAFPLFVTAVLRIRHWGSLQERYFQSKWLKTKNNLFSGPEDFSLHKWILSLWLLSQCFLSGFDSGLRDCARTVTAAVEKTRDLF